MANFNSNLKCPNLRWFKPNAQYDHPSIWAWLNGPMSISASLVWREMLQLCTKPNYLTHTDNNTQSTYRTVAHTNWMLLCLYTHFHKGGKTWCNMQIKNPRSKILGIIYSLKIWFGPDWHKSYVSTTFSGMYCVKSILQVFRPHPYISSIQLMTTPTVKHLDHVFL